jgi:hypothetical protein
MVYLTKQSTTPNIFYLLQELHYVMANSDVDSYVFIKILLDLIPIFSRDGVTKKWIGNWIYWTLTDRNYK